MTERRITLRGESFVTLETAAACFQLRTSWVREIYDAGLLGSGVQFGGELAIATRLFDRLAAIERLHRHYGLELSAIELVIDEISRLPVEGG